MNHEHRPPGNSEVGRMSDQDKRYKQLAPELTLARNIKEEMPTGDPLGGIRLRSVCSQVT